METFETLTRYFSESLCAAAIGMAIIAIIAFVVKTIKNNKH